MAGAGYSQVTAGTSLTTDEFGSILFIDFPGSQWTVDFATIDRQDIFHNADGGPDREKLLEYQLHLSVEDFEAGIKARKEFVDLVVAAGVNLSDDSTFSNSARKMANRESGESCVSQSANRSKQPSFERLTGEFLNRCASVGDFHRTAQLGCVHRIRSGMPKANATVAQRSPGR